MLVAIQTLNMFLEQENCYIYSPSLIAVWFLISIKDLNLSFGSNAITQLEPSISVKRKNKK